MLMINMIFLQTRMQWLEVPEAGDLFRTQQHGFSLRKFLALLNWLHIPHFQQIFLQDLPDLLHVTAGHGDGGDEGRAGEELRSPVPHVPDLQWWSDVAHSGSSESSGQNLVDVPHSTRL